MLNSCLKSSESPSLSWFLWLLILPFPTLNLKTKTHRKFLNKPIHWAPLMYLCHLLNNTIHALAAHPTQPQRGLRSTFIQGVFLTPPNGVATHFLNATGTYVSAHASPSDVFRWEELYNCLFFQGTNSSRSEIPLDPWWVVLNVGLWTELNKFVDGNRKNYMITQFKILRERH